MKKFLASAVAMLLLGCTAAMAQLPSVTLKDINGKTINTEKISNGGKPFIISFFATWCHPCLRELTAISEVYPDWQDETGVKLIAVSIDQAQDAHKVKPLCDSKGFEYEVLLDVNNDLKRALGVNNIPHVFLFDGNGKRVYSHIGYKPGDENELYQKVKELVKKK
ncbi:MAG: TlpA family protein disulfide reductase [Bacteroidales bacterium]|nr:TlpA family protein disulfide reductase [Candidatus Liminaster caballi]